MAGDWIKINSNLWDNPKVAKICDELDEGEASVIGALFRVWSIADQHSEDGLLAGMTERTIDRKTGVQGFADAMRTVGWLEVDDRGVSLPDWDQHHSQSAKRRATDAQRKANSRKPNAKKETSQHPENKGPAQPVRNPSEECPNKNGQSSELEKRREEKNREDKSTPKPPGAKQWVPSKEQKQINSWFSRRDTTQWNDKELRAYRKLMLVEEDLELMARYYQAKMPSDKDYRRRDIGTLLNNWTGELDRARAFAGERDQDKQSDQF